MTDQNAEPLSPTPTPNRCLAALSADALTLLKPHLTEVRLEAGAVLLEAGRPHPFTHFPTNGLLSLTVQMQDGAAIQVGMVGNDGAAGGLDGVTSAEMTTQGRVLIGGLFMRIGRGTLTEFARQNSEIADMLRACLAWLVIQAQQLAACNAAHEAEKRLCRWLMACQRRVGNGVIIATQERIAGLLGIRRTTVTLLAQKLHDSGLIDYTRGKIAIRNPAKLEAAACECCAKLGPAHWPSAQLNAMGNGA